MEDVVVLSRVGGLSCPSRQELRGRVRDGCTDMLPFCLEWSARGGRGIGAIGRVLPLVSASPSCMQICCSRDKPGS